MKQHRKATNRQHGFEISNQRAGKPAPALSQNLFNFIGGQNVRSCGFLHFGCVDPVPGRI
jgi:hypothetical protein